VSTGTRDVADHDTGGVRPEDLDRVIHEPARLALVASLYVVERTDFIFLRKQTGMTGGNLSSHMTKLEDAGYVKVTKRFVGKRPQTLFALTEKGRTAFERYRKSMEDLLRTTGNEENGKN
jgi:DNA-binding MarR family transcriptional regulator